MKENPIAIGTAVKCNLINIGIPVFVRGSQIRHSDNDSYWYHVGVKAAGLSTPEWVLQSSEKGNEFSLWAEMVPESSIRVVGEVAA